MAVKPIPDGYHAVTPYLMVQGVPKLVDFLKQAFGAAETGERVTLPDGSVMHTEVRIRDSVVMMGEANAQCPAMPTMLALYVEDCDSVYRRAVSAGAKSMSEPADQFWGDRGGAVTDPSGNTWWITTHKEDVAPAEMKRRVQAMMTKKSGQGA